MLSNFGIKTTNPSIGSYTKRKDGLVTVGYEFQFYATRANATSMHNFKKRIGFETKYKKDRLDKYLKVIENN